MKTSNIMMILMIFLLGIVTVSSVNAIPYYAMDYTNFTLESNAFVTATYGTKFYPLVNMTIVNMTKTVNDELTDCYIMNYNNTIILAQGIFNGLNCDLNYNVTAYTDYYIMYNNVTINPFQISYGGTVPYQATYINFTYSWDGATDVLVNPTSLVSLGLIILNETVPSPPIPPQPTSITGAVTQVNNGIVSILVALIILAVIIGIIGLLLNHLGMMSKNVMIIMGAVLVALVLIILVLSFKMIGVV